MVQSGAGRSPRPETQPREEKEMNGRYIAFDVETPNYANDRMSAIGIAVE